MKIKMAGAVVALMISPVFAGSAWALKCPWQQPGQPDKIGASRTQTPAKALQAIGLVQTGEVYKLAHNYDEETIPLPFERSFDVTTSTIDIDVTGPSQNFNVGIVSGHIGQIGTQFDALGHAGHDVGYYNCISDIGPDESDRLTGLDAASVKPFFTRGILLDFVNHSGVPKTRVGARTLVLDSYVITLADVQEVLESQGVGAPAEGDVVLFRTGWDSFFGVDDERPFNAPGPGIEVARWLAERKVAMVGADTQAVEAISGGASVELLEDPFILGEELGPLFNAVHFILLTENGIHLLENMRLQDLAADLFRTDGPYEFLFTYAPVPIVGLAGSPGQPLAVR